MLVICFILRAWSKGIKTSCDKAKRSRWPNRVRQKRAKVSLPNKCKFVKNAIA